MFKKHLLTIISGLVITLSAQATTFTLPPNGSDIVGEAFVITSRPGDTLAQIADEYDIGIHEITEANPRLNPRHIRAGSKIVIPTVYILPKFREGIVINIAELRLYYFPKTSNKVYTYPVGLGRRDWRTPTATTTITGKAADPYWHPPRSIRNYVFEQIGKILPDAIPPGPENPLGPYAIYLKKSGYLIHGTNQPWSIGKLISSGCIRLYNRDITELHHLAQVGEPVHLIHHPYKVGFDKNTLYVEAHIPVTMDEPLDQLNVLSIDTALHNKLEGMHGVHVDWQQVNRAVHEHRGMPLSIGQKTDLTASLNVNYHNPNIIFE